MNILLMNILLSKFFIQNKNECRKFEDINLISGIYLLTSS